MPTEEWSREELDATYGPRKEHASAPTRIELMTRNSADDDAELWFDDSYQEDLEPLSESDIETTLRSIVPTTGMNGKIQRLYRKILFTERIADLEHMIINQLRALGMEHEFTWDDERDSFADLRVHHPSGNPARDFEFRITLGTKEPRRLKAFVMDSLHTFDRGTRQCVRVYLEICATTHHKIWLFAERVALTIRDIAHRYQDFGPHRLIGVRVYANQRHHVVDSIDLMRRAHFPVSH
ncbi:hypothetical protein HQ487_03995 [Candidatus Uhrbacteria bacterium]|nr:hypothetical protein [Candidatus Uhrbacteria bacterium]